MAQGELIGRTLGGRFRLTAFLGEGAMASVYRGEQDGEPREVAVKIMHPELHRDATFAKRFAREAKAAARIVHPNSVRILEHGADGDLLYLAMELLTGKDLFEVLARERRLPEARAARVVVQMCGALSAAHAHGIVHRDLKPENVMILPVPGDPGADVVKVLDFGIAKSMERDRRDDPPASGPVESMPPSSVLTMVGGVVGTPEYMSPEQARGLPVDARSDIYACGVLLFHAVTGRQPFTGAAPIDVLMAQVDKAPPAPSSLVPDIHPGMEKLILKALSKDPAERQQSAADLERELTALLPELGKVVSSGKPAPRAAFASAPGSAPTPPTGLPGVPSAVAIQASDPVPPPDTMRSPRQTTEEVDSDAAPTIARPPVGVGLDKTVASPGEEPPAPPAVVKTPAIFDKTLDLGQQAAAPAKPAQRVPVTTAAAFDKTLPLDAAPMPNLDKTLALPPEEKPAPALASTLAMTPEEHAVAAAKDPPREEVVPKPLPGRGPLPGPRPRPAPVVPVEEPRMIPWWAMVAGAVVISFLIWLVRYFRLGGG